MKALEKKVEQLIVRGSLLVDGTGRAPVRNGAVRIQGDRIVSAGEEREIGPLSGARIVDCRDQVLIPGMIDCHNHVSMDPTQQNWPAHLHDGDIEQTLRAVKNLEVDLKS